MRAGIRRRATTYSYSPAERAGADECADYLEHKQDYLDYPAFLAAGWPVASGLIEGAARWIVKDRMEVTGARWGLDGAEAVLKLRALHGTGDLGDYLDYHFQQEKHRNHDSRTSRPRNSPHDRPEHHPITGMSFLQRSRTRPKILVSTDLTSPRSAGLSSPYALVCSCRVDHCRGHD